MTILAFHSGTCARCLYVEAVFGRRVFGFSVKLPGAKRAKWAFCYSFREKAYG